MFATLDGLTLKHGVEFGRRIIFRRLNHMPDATYLKRIIELPAGDNNGTTFKHILNPRGETAEERDEGSTSLDVFLV